METIERNVRLNDHIAFYEIGPVFLPVDGQQLPHEEVHLAAGLTGKRMNDSWDTVRKETFDFYDLKGIVQSLFAGLHIPNIRFEPASCSWLHPGKCATVWSGDVQLGIMGELHPALQQQYDLLSAPVILLDLNLEKAEPLAEKIFKVNPISPFPTILEDIAIIVDEDKSADEVLAVIRQGGGKLLKKAELFDIFRNDQIGAGKKSLAYSLTYQSAEKTLTDKDAAAIRNKIIRRLEQVLEAKLRG